MATEYTGTALSKALADVGTMEGFLRNQPPALTVYGTHRASGAAAVAQGEAIGAAAAQRGIPVRTGAATAVMHAVPAGYRAAFASDSLGSAEPQGVFLRGLPTEQALSPAIHASRIAKTDTFRFRELALMLDHLPAGSTPPGSIATIEGGLSTLTEIAHEIAIMQHGGPLKPLVADPWWQPMLRALYRGASVAVFDHLRFEGEPGKMVEAALSGPKAARGFDVAKFSAQLRAEMTRGFAALDAIGSPAVVVTGPRGAIDAKTRATLREVSKLLAADDEELRLGNGGEAAAAVLSGVRDSGALKRVHAFVDACDEPPRGVERHTFLCKPAQQHTLLHDMKALIVVWPGDADTIANLFSVVTDVRKGRRPSLPIVVLGDIEDAKRVWRLAADLREERLGADAVLLDSAKDSFYGVLFSNSPNEIAATVRGAAPYYAMAYSRRIEVADDKRDWDTPFPEYDPPRVFVVKPNQVATPPRPQASYLRYGNAPARLDAAGLPLHPRGRQGIAGPGAGGAYGPKLAVDAVITREHPSEGLQVLAVLRSDNHLWALPGGKRDRNGEDLEGEALAMQRETREETGINLPVSAFESAPIVFEGLCDDPRDTDNFWFETQARRLHLPWAVAKDLVPCDSDVDGAAWLNVDEALSLVVHANHRRVLEVALGAS